MNRKPLGLMLVAAVLTQGEAFGEASSDSLASIVAAHATRYIQSLPEPERPGHRDQIFEAFARQFVRGLKNGVQSWSAKTEALDSIAYNAGKEYRRENPQDALRLISQSYENTGYAEIRIEGVWTIGFETSSLEAAALGGNKCWLWVPSSAMGQVFPLTDEERSNRSLTWQLRSATVRVHGFLSPPGRHGHLGSYRCAIDAIEVSRVSN